MLVTLHRPSNVDDHVRLGQHRRRPGRPRRRTRRSCSPSTRARARGWPTTAGWRGSRPRACACIEPVAYLEFLSLQAGAGAIVTDSGGVQEEASALGVSCFTFRPNTERPVTLTHGTNVLLGDDPAEIAEVRPATHPPTPCAIPLWDGHAAERVADVLVANYALVRAVARG